MSDISHNESLPSINENFRHVIDDDNDIFDCMIYANNGDLMNRHLNKHGEYTFDDLFAVSHFNSFHHNIFDEDVVTDVIQTTDASVIPYTIDKCEQEENEYVHGHVILNLACTLLSRRDKDIVSY